MDEKETLWSERVAAWRASGLSMRKFAQEQDWAPRQLTYWARRLAASSRTSPGPVLIPVIAPRAALGEMLRLTTTSGHRLDLPVGTSAVWLAELLRALG